MAYPTAGTEILTLAEVKSYNNISVATYDTFISTLIPVVCRSIENYCRRRFCKYDWIQWYRRNREIFLDEYPVNNVLLVGVPYECFSVVDTSETLQFNLTQENSRILNSASKFIVTNTETLTTTEYALTTYTTIGALKTAVEAAHATVTFTYKTAPGSITFANLNTKTLRPGMGGVFVVGVNVFDQYTTAPSEDIYRLSDDSDRLLFGDMIGWYGDEDTYPQDTLVISNTGYSTTEMPQELKWVAAAMCQDVMSIYDVTGSGSYIGIYQSETLGDYSYKIGNVGMTIGGYSGNSFISDLVNTKYSAMLDFYKKKNI